MSPFNHFLMMIGFAYNFIKSFPKVFPLFGDQMSIKSICPYLDNECQSVLSTQLFLKNAMKLKKLREILHIA
jgi:hypothetical protein